MGEHCVILTIQVDLAWSFGHPLGSTPAAVCGEVVAEGSKVRTETLAS